MTVAYLAAQVDVVLMDLRGFTPASRGCTFEIGMLLNSVSVPLKARTQPPEWHWLCHGLWTASKIVISSLY
jgi:hypothetical protein